MNKLKSNYNPQAITVAISHALKIWKKNEYYYNFRSQTLHSISAGVIGTARLMIIILRLAHPPTC